tara:strand:- start:1254 stop:3353 length:2100 start_codon:yes stop_codon:yes gene_type:complete
MKIALKNFKNGNVLLEEAPVPDISENEVLIKNIYSVISPGTEKMLMEFGRANMLSKALQQPERVKDVINKISNDGLKATYDSVNSKLHEWTTSGYSSCGKVIESKTDEFKAGDLVISNGPHSEYVAVNKNLCSLVPDNVSLLDASFTVLASVALQALRLAKPSQGETFVVYGLGLIGLILVQLLRSNGCKVMGVDVDENRLKLASKFGAFTHNNLKDSSLINSSLSFSKNRGVDGVFLTLASKSDLPISEAAQMCRKKGRIILTGVTGLNLNRQDFYEKEISFRVSSSYGPGRYDPSYEDKGIDYPYGYVRWTEKRNFEAILDLLSTKAVSFKQLISHEYEFESVSKAYDSLLKENSLGIVLKYSGDQNGFTKKISIKQKQKSSIDDESPSLALIGAGEHSQKSILPFLSNNFFNLDTLAGKKGISLIKVAKKFNFESVSTDIEDIFSSKTINTVIISSRHDSHAELTLKAIKNNQNVFVEKPLSLNLDDIKKIKKELSNYTGNLLVGFNRRFSPVTLIIKNLLQTVNSQKSFIYNINAGKLSQDHWVKDPKIGGGRIIGEICHFLDLLIFLTGEKIVNFSISSMDDSLEDCFIITLNFKDGSVACINYFSNGHPKVEKENLKIFTEGKYLEMNNFLKINGYGWKNFSKKTFFYQQKGHKECIHKFLHSVKNGLDSPIELDELIHVSELSIEINNALRK